jgi:hypothetical protein
MNQEFDVFSLSFQDVKLILDVFLELAQPLLPLFESAGNLVQIRLSHLDAFVFERLLVLLFLLQQLLLPNIQALLPVNQ